MTTRKTIALTIWTFVGKVMSLLFNMLSRFVRAFLPRSKSLLISRLQLPSAVILEPPQNKISHCFHCFSILSYEVMGLDVMILVFWMLRFKVTFPLSCSTFIKRLFGSTFCHKGGVIFNLTDKGKVIDISPNNLDSSLCFHPAWNFAWYTLHIS